MKIEKAIKTDDGATYSGSFTDAEVDFLLEVGMNVLVARGVVPVTEKTLAPSTGTVQ